MKKIFILFFLLLTASGLSAQMLTQYFDGADTSGYYIIVDTTVDTGHVWQIGRPQKTIFDTAATVPNVIITDTVDPHRLNVTSSFILSAHPIFYSRGLKALRWKQKIDFCSGHAGGMVEYSMDSGKIWNNAFNDPDIYSFYGFDPANKDTLLTGEYAFSGTDTAWKDIWLCFPYKIYEKTDSLLIRFTLKSDTVDSAREGWMIDNFILHPTFVHSASKMLRSLEKINVYPNVTTGPVYIDHDVIRKSNTIRNMLLINAAGMVVHEYTKFEAEVGVIDIGQYPPGAYLLKINTDSRTTTHKLLLKQ